MKRVPKESSNSRTNIRNWFDNFSSGREKSVVAVMLFMVVLMTCTVIVTRYKKKNQPISKKEIIPLEEPRLKTADRGINTEQINQSYEDYQSIKRDEEMLDELEALLLADSADTTRIKYLYKQLEKYFIEWKH